MNFTVLQKLLISRISRNCIYTPKSTNLNFGNSWYIKRSQFSKFHSPLNKYALFTHIFPRLHRVGDTKSRLRAFHSGGHLIIFRQWRVTDRRTFICFKASCRNFERTKTRKVVYKEIFSGISIRNIFSDHFNDLRIVSYAQRRVFFVVMVTQLPWLFKNVSVQNF